MNPEPRLNKIPFIVADACCLLAAAAIGYTAKSPITPVPLISCVVLIIAGGIAVLFPFFSDYAADSRESSARLRDELELQIKRVQAAAESLGRAAAQIKSIEEAVQKSARDAETLPYRMQEKLAEFNEALAAKENEERDALERELEELRAANSDQLKAVADKLAKATADWTALESAGRRQVSLAQDAAGKIDGSLRRALDQLDARLAGLEKSLRSDPPPPAANLAAPASPEPQPAPSIQPAPEAFVAPPPPVASPEEIPVIVAVSNGVAPAPEAPKVRKPRPARRPKPEEVLVAMSNGAPETEAAPVAVAVALDEPPPTTQEASVSSDGATRLLATAYIGIGNKLFIRGDGPGLSWEKGVPMQFVSIGKWGWSTQDAAGPVSVKLYKNDDTAALSGGLTIEPGRHTEITALF
ncbi:MAG TPA: hypothetical protein VHD32_08610 [Candidatus Didemnitutus sp.]|nr:hypothetical protein [Candidatus Didemnitutus sp.]